MLSVMPASDRADLEDRVEKLESRLSAMLAILDAPYPLEVAECPKVRITASYVQDLARRPRAGRWCGSSTAEFERLAAVYAGILDRATLQRTHNVESAVSGELRALAAELGYRNARPRDLIALHKTVFQRKCRELASGSAMVLLEEARLVLLETMGHLASYYREFRTFAPDSAGVSPPKPPE